MENCLSKSYFSSGLELHTWKTKHPADELVEGVGARTIKKVATNKILSQQAAKVLLATPERYLKIQYFEALRLTLKADEGPLF